jgi:hypothetical protein
MHPLSLQIVTKLIRDILSEGFTINVWDTEAFALNTPSDNLQTILAHLGQTDEETLYIYRPNKGSFYQDEIKAPLETKVVLIYDPDDPTSVIADYYTSTSNLTAGAEALAEALETQPNNTRLIALIENAPVWAYHWAQNASGAGLYWEHKPQALGVTGVWIRGSTCWEPGHKCKNKRFDLRFHLQNDTPWIKTLVEIKKIKK